MGAADTERGIEQREHLVGRRGGEHRARLVAGWAALPASTWVRPAPTSSWRRTLAILPRDSCASRSDEAGTIAAITVLDRVAALLTRRSPPRLPPPRRSAATAASHISECPRRGRQRCAEGRDRDRQGQRDERRQVRPATDRRSAPAAVAHDRGRPESSKTATGLPGPVRGRTRQITTPTVYDRKVILSGRLQVQGSCSRSRPAPASRCGCIDLHDDGPSSPACESGVCVINTESCTIFRASTPSTGKQLWSVLARRPAGPARPRLPATACSRRIPPRARTIDKKPGAAGSQPRARRVRAFKTRKVPWQMWLAVRRDVGAGRGRRVRLRHDVRRHA